MIAAGSSEGGCVCTNDGRAGVPPGDLCVQAIDKLNKQIQMCATYCVYMYNALYNVMCICKCIWLYMHTLYLYSI